jgi:benzoyl-CoA reductase/2-hydroxyglutaryl-CoA dehydratase subunit BcrC/BadD/HgdB
MGRGMMDVPESRQRLKELMSGYYSGLDKAARSREGRVAWCSSISPPELPLALGFEVYFPENHGALLGATRAAGETIPHALAAGYSPETCSYLTSDIGAHLAGVSPLTKAHGLSGPPRPDILVYNNNQCREIQDWFMFYARKWKVPLVGVSSPRVLAQVKTSHLQDVTSQLKGMIPALEEAAGTRFDPDRLKEIVRLSKACTVRWQKVLERSAQSPALLTFFDHCIHMAPAVVMRGRQEALDYYDLLLEEMDRGAAESPAQEPGETLRFYWDGMPIWGALRYLSRLFKKLGTEVVASTYCNSWLFPALDPEKPLESMARAGLECFNVRDEDFKERYILDQVERFKAQGVVFHNAKTCPYNTNTRFGMPARLQTGHGVPVLILDGDLNDLRCFSQEQAVTLLEAFVEQLKEKA